MNADVLTTRAADGIAVITLGSAKRIYFDAEMGDALTEALDGFAGDPNVRVVIVTGGAPGYFNRHFNIPALIQIAESLCASGRQWPENATYNRGFFDKAMALCESNPEFYLAHFDLTGKIGNIMTAVGASGLPILMDTFVHLTKSPVISIAKIRGCVRGVSSEFVLACDMRFASRENTRLGQPEVGVGLHPGGGGTERLPHLVGRGRALEIVLGANDFDGDTAERYGYVNRALPDAELDGFVDALARRIASFDRRAIAAAKG